MDILQILLAALAGTVVMTVFSYAVSAAYRKLFKEPVLLNIMLERLGLDLAESSRSYVGYVLHYIFGILFVAGYEIVWHFTAWEPDWYFAILFGMVSGIVGILGWMLIFSLVRNKPKVHFRQYYVQLFIAHIIFACGVVAVYRIMA